MERIEKAVDSLLVRTKAEVLTRIEPININLNIEDTKAICHFYALKSDANDNLRVNDLIDFIDEKVVDYAIPKKEIDEALEYQLETGSSSKLVKLRRKAIGLFTDLKKTGEGGELLLYILILEILKIPQLISKMSLKTSGQVHYHGSDGIHVDYNTKNNTLNLYWGESKMYATISTAISECFKSLKGFLLDPYSYKSTQERDLDLITDNITKNVNNKEYEDLIVAYFDKDNDLSNRLVYKGICFIGYDLKDYKQLNISKTIEDIKSKILTEVAKNQVLLSKAIKTHKKLETKEIHIFLIPFPSVKDFRKYYLEVLK